MDLTPFKRDIDELIDEFVESESTTLADMKKAWVSRKFSYIFEASPSNNLAFFMQSLYAHTISRMCDAGDSLSRKLGGLYCLYCLYETQPFKPPFKIYLSLRELEKLRCLVGEAKSRDITVVPALVKRMLETNMFLFGFVDLNEGSASDVVKELVEFQNNCIKVASDKLFKDSGRIKEFLHMDLGKEVEVNLLKKMSMEYVDAKKQASEATSEIVDVQNLKHISESNKSFGIVMESLVENWNVQKETFCEQTGITAPRNDDDYDDDAFDEIDQLLEQP